MNATAQTTETTKPVAVAAQNEIVLNPNIPREREIILIEREFAFMQRRARMFAESDIVPATYQGKMANCLIAMEIARRMNTGEMQIMQSLYIVHGRPAFDAKYMIAMVNSSGILRGRLKYVFSGEKGSSDYGCYAWGIEEATGERIEGPRISMEMVNAEGWIKNPKWKTMPELMFTYRAAAFWTRTNAPELLLGMQTIEEVEDVYGERDITPQQRPAGTVQEMLSSAKKSAVETDGPVVIDGEAATDGETNGESQQSSLLGDATAISMSSVQKQLESARTIGELNNAADLIREVPNPTHRELLNGVYDKRSAELQ